jgi:hypothetical protein
MLLSLYIEEDLPVSIEASEVAPRIQTQSPVLVVYRNLSLNVASQQSKRIEPICLYQYCSFK